MKSRSQKKSDEVVQVTIAPTNTMAEPHFGVVDGVIVILFVFFAGSLIYWILG